MDSKDLLSRLAQLDFRSGGDGELQLDDANEEMFLDTLSFGSGFDLPLTGLPGLSLGLEEAEAPASAALLTGADIAAWEKGAALAAADAFGDDTLSSMLSFAVDDDAGVPKPPPGLAARPPPGLATKPAAAPPAALSAADLEQQMMQEAAAAAQQSAAAAPATPLPAGLLAPLLPTPAAFPQPGPAAAAAAAAPAMHEAVLPPVTVLGMQARLAHVASIAASMPDRGASMPPQVRQEVAHIQAALARQALLLQHLPVLQQQHWQQQFMQLQWQQQQQAAMAAAAAAGGARHALPGMPTAAHPQQQQQQGALLPTPSKAAEPAAPREREVRQPPAVRPSNQAALPARTSLMSYPSVIRRAVEMPLAILRRAAGGGAAAGAGARQPPLTLASVLGSQLPPPGAPGSGGQYMTPNELYGVCKWVYGTLAMAQAAGGASGDVFTEAYYLFALNVKRRMLQARAQTLAERAAAAAAAAAAGLIATPAADGRTASPASANVLDVAAVLTTMGAGAGRDAKKQQRGAGGAAPRRSAASKSRSDEQPGALTAGAAPQQQQQQQPESSAFQEIVGPVLGATQLQMRISAAMLHERKIATMKREKWLARENVLGKIESTSYRAPKTALALEAVEADKSAAAESAHGGLDAASLSPEQAEALAVWAARRRVEACQGTILQLQAEALKRQEGAQQRVMRLKILLAYHLGLRKSDATAEAVLDFGTADQEHAALIAALQEEKEAELMRAQRQAGNAQGHGYSRRPQTAVALPPGSVPPAPVPPTVSPVPSLSAPELIDDTSFLALLSLPKGKKVIRRAFPLLSLPDRVTAICAAMRHLPHWVASAAVGAEAEEQDAALAAMLAHALKEQQALPSSAAAGLTGAAAENAAVLCSELRLMSMWVRELHSSQPGAVIRALLQHSGASEVIAALLFRGEQLAKKLEEEAAASKGGANAPTAALEQVAEWKLVTEALGSAFVEAE